MKRCRYLAYSFGKSLYYCRAGFCVKPKCSGYCSADDLVVSYSFLPGSSPVLSLVAVQNVLSLHYVY